MEKEPTDADSHTTPREQCVSKTDDDSAEHCDYDYPDDLATKLKKTTQNKMIEDVLLDAHGLEYKHTVASAQDTPEQTPRHTNKESENVVFAEQLPDLSIGDAPFVDVEAVEVPELQLRNEEIGQLEAIVQQNTKRTRKTYFAATIIGLFVVSVASLVGVMCGDGGCGGRVAPPLFSQSEIEERAEALSLLVNSLNLTEGPISYPPTSDSAIERALEWMATDDGFLVNFDDSSKVLQRFALAALFLQNGPWKFATIEDESYDWMTINDDCSWMGVACTMNTSQVGYLNLGGVGASGTIPETIGMLSSLQLLDFRSNGLSGAVPGSLFQLTKLRRLDLALNSFTGFPLDNVLLLSNLEVLDLSSNGFTERLSFSFESFPSLTFINLSGNFLAGIVPASIGLLTSLTLSLIHI